MSDSRIHSDPLAPEQLIRQRLSRPAARWRNEARPTTRRARSPSARPVMSRRHSQRPTCGVGNWRMMLTAIRYPPGQNFTHASPEHAPSARRRASAADASWYWFSVDFSGHLWSSCLFGGGDGPSAGYSGRSPVDRSDCRFVRKPGFIARATSRSLGRWIDQALGALVAAICRPVRRIGFLELAFGIRCRHIGGGTSTFAVGHY
jgi:hypothetical protein